MSENIEYDAYETVYSSKGNLPIVYWTSVTDHGFPNPVKIAPESSRSANIYGELCKFFLDIRP